MRHASALLTIGSFMVLAVILVGCADRNARPQANGNSAVPMMDAAPAAGTDFGAEASRLVYGEDEIVSILENGLVVIAKRVSSPVVTVRGYVRTGGVYEGRWLGGGLSHLLEHLVAGGSTERRTEAENRNLLQQIGNNSNAYTTADHTAYFVNTTTESLDKAVDLVTGWLFGAKITPAEYQREYEVVQRELEKDKGEPDWVFYHLTTANRYLVSPARVPTIGYQEVIRGLTRDDIYEYYKLAYQPNNMLFAIAGDVDPEVMLAAVQKHVRNAPPGRAFDHDIPAEPPVLAPRTLVTTFPKLGQAKLQLAFPTILLSHPDLYALDLLSTILTTGESSLLVEEIRDKRGLVSSISSYSHTPEFVDGTFAISMELSHDRIAEATEAVLEQIERIRTSGINQDRLSRAKVQTRTARAFGQQTSAAVAASMATDFLSTGDPHFSERYVERTQEVTAEQVREMAVKYLDRSRLLTTAMLPEEAVAPASLPKAAALLRPLAPRADESPAEAQTKTTRTELEDGTILLLKRVPTAPIAVVQLYALGGLTAEDDDTNGLGNLTMQTAQRGTRTRSAQEIAEFFDSIGGDLSTTCGNNTWVWSATCLKDDLAGTLEVFADVVKNPTFPESEVDSMKKRIMAAIEAQNAHWFIQSMRFFRKAYFGAAGSPYQFMTVGTSENVGRFTAEQARRWHSDRILSSRRVLAIFGDIDIDKARALAAQHFKGDAVLRPADAAAAAMDDKAPGSPSGAAAERPAVLVQRVEVNPTSNPQAGVMIGFDSETVVGSPSVFPLTVADTLASGFGYPTGYIFEILRGRGLVYDSHAFLFPGRSREYPGTFIIYAGCDPKDVNEVVDVILENMARLQGSAEEMQPEWFERSKKLIVTSDALQNETPAAQAATAALDELMGLGYDYHDQFADKIEAVEIRDVQATARRLLRRCVVTVTTSRPEAVKVEPGERTYDSFPPVDLTPQGVVHDAPGAN